MKGGPALKSLLILLVAGAVALPISVLFWPASLGGDVSYVVVKGVSMQPTLYEGDLALVRKHDNYKPGDIVAYRVPEGEQGEGAIIIHRIVGGDAENGYVLLGDNRRSEDRWHPRAGDVIGSTWFHVDGLGEWFAKLFEPMGRTLLVGGVALFLLIGNGGSREGAGLPRTRRPRSQLLIAISHEGRRASASRQ